MGPLETDTLCCYEHEMLVRHIYGSFSKILLRVSFYTYIDRKTYQVVMHPTSNRSEVNRIDRIPMPHGSSPMELPTIIKKFEHIINISPENAASKIKTIITFS